VVGPKTNEGGSYDNACIITDLSRTLFAFQPTSCVPRRAAGTNQLISAMEYKNFDILFGKFN
jgi:hypothetical protein